jgi:hypothetical protein
MDRPGATGKFSDGKISPDDEGDLRFSLFIQHGRLILDFGKPVAWIGLTADQAKEIGERMIEAAYRLINPKYF